MACVQQTRLKCAKATEIGDGYVGPLRIPHGEDWNGHCCWRGIAVQYIEVNIISDSLVTAKLPIEHYDLVLEQNS